MTAAFLCAFSSGRNSALYCFFARVRLVYLIIVRTDLRCARTAFRVLMACSTSVVFLSARSER